LVQPHAGNLLAIPNLFARNRGRLLRANDVRQPRPEAIARLVADANLALAIRSTLLAMRVGGSRNLRIFGE
jgi:hypothetical protein